MEKYSSITDKNIQTIQNTEAYPNYPTKRLVMNKINYDENDRPIIPGGEWTINNTPLPTAEEIRNFQINNIQTDSFGRPLHPLHESMLNDSSIGAITGKGKYYNWGPNHTADSIIIASDIEPKILLIQRNDTGLWALPGGFIDSDENAVTAAARELYEETNLDIKDKSPTLIYQGIVNDPRTTINSWPETTAYLWNIDIPAVICAGDDVEKSAWFTKDNIPDNLFGSHKELIKLAFDHQHESELVSMLNSLSESNDITETAGGHMAYEHLIIKNDEKNIFLKIINADKLHDQSDTINLQKYIQKEKMYYDYLLAKRFLAIPSNIHLINNKTLEMDSLTTDDGWHWRIPGDISISKQYISDILDTLSNLNEIAVPDFIDKQLNITPTFQTLWDEGWATIDDQKINEIKNKIESFSSSFRAESTNDLINLCNNLNNLQNAAYKSEISEDLVLSHNDARQSNITWHKYHGVKVVDWAWAGLAPKNADSTMFLIDLAKSDYEIDFYIDDYFNKDHALILIGFWLNHSTQNNPNDSETIRFQQIISALAAYKLISRQN